MNSPQNPRGFLTGDESEDQRKRLDLSRRVVAAGLAAATPGLELATPADRRKRWLRRAAKAIFWAVFFYGIYLAASVYFAWDRIIGQAVHQ